MHERLYRSNRTLNRSVNELEEFISKMNIKERQLQRAIDVEENRLKELKLNLGKKESLFRSALSFMHSVPTVMVIERFAIP